MIKKEPVSWDHYLQPEVVKYYEDKGVHNPREIEILTNIMNEKKPEKLPFKMTEEEKKFYQRSLAQYGEMKKAHPGKKVYFEFPFGD